MTQLLIVPQASSTYAGTVDITFHAKYKGNVPVDATFVMTVYKSSTVYGVYNQVVHFEVGEEKDIPPFTHKVNADGDTDINLEVDVGDSIAYSHSWSSVFTSSTAAAFDFSSLMSMMVMVMMMGMIMPMMSSTTQSSSAKSSGKKTTSRRKVESFELD